MAESEHPQRRPSEGADVVPIGTSGRPGRGTGKARPSAAARNLAPSPRKATARKASRPTPVRPVRPEAADEAATTSADTAPAAEHAAPRAATTTEETHPLAGIPVGDWLHAFQHAAVELFGDQWERRLAEFMAFLRRRLAGDYTVDEYG